MDKNGIYIPSIDAKDLYGANHLLHGQPDGYSLRKPDGSLRLRKFINSLDPSLDLMQLRKVYKKKYRRQDFSFCAGRKEYSFRVINVTFQYAYRQYNQIRRNTYVKAGYDLRESDFEDGAAVRDGVLAGIIVEEPVLSALDSSLLPPCFTYDENRKCYRKVRDSAVILSCADLRRDLYQNGFLCEGIHYVRLKRSSGSARVGKCLFVDEALYKDFHKWELCGLDIRYGQPVDLAALESYIALTSSSIIGTLEIRPEQILILDDYQSVFQDDCAACRDVGGHLVSREERLRLSNQIWDGQSLMDRSLFGPYQDKGMLLLRNRMFKSCCFNANIQQWFQDCNIRDVSSLGGFTLARSVDEIRLITTKSSIKYVKFGSVQNWLLHMDPVFGIVKFEKKTPFFGGRLVQTHYQLLNTLELNEEDMSRFLQPSLDYARKLRTDPAYVRHYLQMSPDTEYDGAPLKSRSAVIYAIMSANDLFTQTRFYHQFLNELMRSYYKNLKKGHVLVNGNYSVLLGNPIEMLQSAAGCFHGESVLGRGNICSLRFEEGKDLLASRSPHCCAGNILVARNVRHPLLNRYINQTEEIVCINSIGENILSRLSGADFDSDTVLLTDNPVLLRAAKKNYSVFKTPTAVLSDQKKQRRYTPQDQAELDIDTSVNKIGEIINFSQRLGSLYWDRIASGKTHEECKPLYYDIVTLDIMSGIEIDKAKKEFTVDNSAELRHLEEKYYEDLHEQDQKVMPYFFSHIDRLKGYYNKETKLYRRHKTSMDYLQKRVNSFRVRSKIKYEDLPFSYILDPSRVYSYHINHAQIREILCEIRQYLDYSGYVYANCENRQERRALIEQRYEELTERFCRERIGRSTLYTLLSQVDSDQPSSVKNVLLTLLFEHSSDSFAAALKEAAGPIEFIELGGTDEEVFGIGIQKITKNPDEPFKN